MKPRAIISVTLRQLDSLGFMGIELKPNCHAWVDDASIQAALDGGLSEDTLRSHHTNPDTNRAVRIASYVRMIDAGTLPRKFYAELYFRGTALRFKIIDGQHRWRAMQFRRDPLPTTIHVFEQFHHLEDALPPSAIVALQYS